MAGVASAVFSETALRARTSAGSFAKEICAENRTSRSNERKENFHRDLQNYWIVGIAGKSDSLRVAGGFGLSGLEYVL